METQNEKIIQSWNENAGLWTNAVRTQAIESRHLVTNDAILQTVLACGGTRILDVGCGEGWLSRELMKNEKDVTGFDASANLVEQARKDSTTQLKILSYENFIADPRAVGKDYDVVVCNFSLLGDHLDEVLKALFSVTKPSGHLVIQTLHPYSSVGDHPYEDGWREETFQGLSGKWSPMPWYFRTMRSWIRELASAGWNLSALKEPLHPGTGKPASLILDARKK